MKLLIALETPAPRLWMLGTMLFMFFSLCVLVTSPEEVVHRYQMVLKNFKKTKSVNRACNLYGVDRNTIALTAIIAEIHIAAEGVKCQMPKIGQGRVLRRMHKRFLEENPVL